MKINIELSPNELADFLAVFGVNFTSCLRHNEEALAEMLLKTKKIEVTSKKEEDDGLIKNPEDLYHGYTH